MSQPDTYIVVIDQLPEERFEAMDVRDAARKVAAMIAGRDRLQRLADDEPVQIKRSDRSPWGRNLSLGDFRHGDPASEGDEAEGPIRLAIPSA